MKTVKLSKAEIDYIIALIEYNHDEGTYWGNQKHFWQRSFKLKEKLIKLYGN